MPVRLRFARQGSRNRPFFRLVAIDGRRAPTGRYIENLGWYNPGNDGVNYHIKLDRVDYWTGCGAQLSDSARSIVKKARKYQPADAEAKAEPAADADAPAAEAAAPAAEAPAAEEAAPAVEAAAPAAEEAAPAEKAPAAEAASAAEATETPEA